MNKEEIISLIEHYATTVEGPLQYTKEWYEIRKKGGRKRGRIGGSDIATLLGMSKYKKRRTLLLEKQGKKQPDFLDDKLDVWFGSLFEEVAGMAFELTYKTKILCQNICIVSPCNMDYFMYSPDGITALPYHGTNVTNIDLDYENENYGKNCNYIPVLVEIKCPTSRELTKEGAVPEHYYPQLQAGILAAEIVYSSIFIDNKIRVCTYEDVLKNDGSFNRSYIHKFCKLPVEDAPYYRGAIFFYGNFPKGIYKNYVEKISLGSVETYDIGGSSYKTLTKFLVDSKKQVLRTKYLPISDDLGNIINEAKKEPPNFIICWKLFDTTYTLVHKDAEMIQNIQKTMQEYSIGEYDVETEEEIIMVPDNTKSSLVLNFDDDD